jgi:putative ABC transport system permease protein
MSQMIRREYYRFVKRNPLGTLLLLLLLIVGFTGSSVTYTIMQLMLVPKSSGLRSMAYATIAEDSSGGIRPVSWKTYERLRETADSNGLALVAYAEPIKVHLSFGQNEEDISVAAASDGFFSAFTERLNGAEDFSSSWQAHNGGTEIILSNSLAGRLFSNAGEALGRSLSLNNQTFRIIGVAPKSLSGLWSSTDAWVTPNKIISLSFGVVAGMSQPGGEKSSPVLDNPDMWQKSHLFYVLVGSSAPLARLRQKLEKLVRSPENAQGNLHVSDGLTKDPARDVKVRSWARLALLLSAALLFATALNYCGLLLAQAPRYVEELRLKRVLGANLLRIVIESMCGPMITVLAGFIVATYCTINVLWLISKHELHFLLAGGISWKMGAGILGMGLAIACILAFLIALIPTLRLLHDSGVPQMGYTSTSGKKMNLVLYGVVSGQIASCIVICLIAAMIVVAVRSLSREALGFRSDHLSVFTVAPATKNMPFSFSTSDARDFPLAAFTRGVVAKSSNTISGVAAASCAPLAQPLKTISMQRLDRGLPPLTVHFCAVSRDFFQIMGNTIVEGSTFSDDTFTGEVHELVINRKLASELWPEERPLHQTVRIEEPAWGIQLTGELVGISQDMRFSGLTNTPDATVFLPLKGNVFTLSFPLYFMSKGATSLHPMDGFIQRQATSSGLSLGVSSSYNVNERLRESFMEQRVRVWLSAGGAMLVAVIAYLGLYGVLVHSINSRRRELAIRSCFGASDRKVRMLIVQKALKCSAAAIALSLLAWRPINLMVSRAWIGKMELSWLLIIIIPLLCMMTAVGISFKPAWEATKVSPSELLKGQ